MISFRSIAGIGRTRAIAAILCRSTLIVLLVLALAGMQRVRESDHQTTIFVLDQSASIPRDRQNEALEFIRRAADSARPLKDHIGLVAFDGSAWVEQLARPRLIVDRLAGGNRPGQSHQAAGLRLGLALFPPSSSRRIVLISDGNETIGRALSEADACAAGGTPIDVLPIRYTATGEMMLESLTTPASASRDETVRISLVARAQSATNARVQLFHNDKLLDLDPDSAETGMPIDLPAGASRFTVQVPLAAEGAHRFRAVLEPGPGATDAVIANNQARGLTRVGTGQRALVVADSYGTADDDPRADAEILARALRAARIDCDVMSLASTPIDASLLTAYSLVVLSNVSAVSLGESGQAALASYVRDLGGGLLAVGGDRSFSMGGYSGTPLGQIMPVETERSKLTMLSVAMAIVIDRSGSMMGEKLDLARQGAIGAVKLLGARDRVGVIGFDGSPDWVVPLTRCEDKAAIVQRIHAIGSGGGTAMGPALELALKGMVDVPSNLRHAIVLTDGQSIEADFEGIARAFKSAGVTISTIAVGEGADRRLLSRIAEISGGRMYATDGASPIPQIFARETTIASRSGLFEQSFQPLLRIAPGESVLTGFAQADFPPLGGHVLTLAKPLVHAPLVRATSDGVAPLLAYWQVGLGRTVAFTSGHWSRWGADWVDWPGFSKLLAQCAQYASRRADDGAFRVETRVEGDRARLIVDADGLTANQIASLAIAGQVVSPSFERRPIDLLRTGPSRFEAVVPVDSQGIHAVGLAYQYRDGKETRAGGIHSSVIVDYSPEFATVTDNAALLADLAARTGGRVLDPSRPASVFDPAVVRPERARLPVWEDLVRLALLVFLLDVAIRRLSLHPFAAAARLRVRIGELAGAKVADTVATVGALRTVRDRARVEPPAEPKSTGRAPRSDPVSLDDPLPPLPESNRPTPNVDSPAPSDGEYLSRLRSAKRRATESNDSESS